MQRFSIRGQKSLSLLSKVLIPVENVNCDEDVNHSDRVDKMDSGTEASNEEFFRRVLTYRPLTKVWREGAPLGIRVKDVR